LILFALGIKTGQEHPFQRINETKKDGSTKKEKKRFDKDEQRAVNFDLSLFWRLENFANLDGADAVESTERFDSFADEITRLPDGRYCTPIPWKTDKWRLQRNLKMASCRIDSTLVRLRKNLQDLADYDKEIQQLIEKSRISSWRKQTWNTTDTTRIYHIIQCIGKTNQQQRFDPFSTEQPKQNSDRV
jgi:hypothetical protein